MPRDLRFVDPVRMEKRKEAQHQHDERREQTLPLHADAVDTDSTVVGALFSICFQRWMENVGLGRHKVSRAGFKGNYAHTCEDIPCRTV